MEGQNDMRMRYALASKQADVELTSVAVNRKKVYGSWCVFQLVGNEG